MDAGGRAPTVGALGDAGAVAEKSWNLGIERGLKIPRYARNDKVQLNSYVTARPL